MTVPRSVKGCTTVEIVVDGNRLADGWHVLEDGGSIRNGDPFRDVNDALPLAQTIRNIENKPVTLFLICDGTMRELMRW